MRQSSLRSKRIRLTLVVALAACSSLVLAAPAFAAPSLSLSAPAHQPQDNAYVDVSGTTDESGEVYIYAQPDNGGSCPSTRTQTLGSERARTPVEPGPPFSFRPQIARGDWPMNPGAYLLCGYMYDSTSQSANAETRTTINEPPCPHAFCAPPGHVFGNPVVTIKSASYRQLPNTKGVFGDGRLSVHGVINPQGRPGSWGFQYSSKPNFVSAFGGGCGTHAGDFNGRIDTYDSADHPVSASPAGSASHPSMKPECWISPQSQPSPLYVRIWYHTDNVTYSDGYTYPETNGCGGPGQQVPGPPLPSCHSNTLVVPFEFKPGGSKKQLITALRGSLAPKGAAAKIGAILKKGFSPARFKAPSAGGAGVTWTLPASGARAAKKVVVAKGTKKVSRAGKTTIKVKLTKRGKALLKQAKRARKGLKLKATGSFKPRGGSKVSTSRTIKLKN